MTDLTPNNFQGRVLPAVAVRGAVIFPHTEAMLTFGRPKTRAAVSASYASDRYLGIFTQKDARIADPDVSDLYPIGTLVTIQQIMPTENEIHVLVAGKSRIKIEDVVSQSPYAVYRVSELADEHGKAEVEEALARHLVKLFEKAVRLGRPVDVQVVMRLLSSQVSPEELVDQIAYLLELKTSEKQKLLETLSVEKRLRKVMEYLTREVSILELERSITTKTQKRFEEQMRKAMLREHQKTIEEELKDLGEGDDELSELKKQIAKAKMPKEVKKKAEKELNRLSQMPPGHPESGYIRNYLDWLVELPWGKKTSDKVSLKKAAQVLNQDHYALEKTKERILEYLAVLQLKQKKTKSSSQNEKEQVHDGNSPTILCFIGPPGVGKTSIGRSIARALGRKFIRISLGGIRDEAEIRGHRRTYVGAMPGRIIQGMKNAGTMNPVFMLDEIDKLGTDFRGDPSSALLEVLDPEQNKEFSDHYLEIPFDLSDVMFICTGNVLETIPPALRDRMEVIRFSGYMEEEKYNIAKRFLWPKQLRNHGLPTIIKISPAALREIINRYTREAGVRNLERKLAAIARKLAREVAEGKKVQKEVKKSDLHAFLGPYQYSSLLAETKDEVGVATGLAYTPVGGQIIFIETVLMPGKGKLTLTGQLGDVMKESALAAFSYAKSHAKELGIKKDFSALDVHIHVPEGAVPKDGPSAGVAMAVSLISALTGKPVRRDVGMTGEITLRGRVMEIGGLKEKVIAGHRAGLKTIIAPKENKKDLEEIPEGVRRDIQFVFVDHLDAVLNVVFNIPSFKRAKNKVATAIASPAAMN